MLAKGRTVTIDYLQNHPRHIPLLARWQHAQWGGLTPGRTLEERIEKIRSTLQGRAIPTTLVALAAEDLLGSASLIVSDMKTRPELTPWLASVYVAADARGRGVGSALVRAAVAEAAALGIGRLYLITPDREALYTRLGWTTRERTAYRGQDVALMSIDPVE